MASVPPPELRLEKPEALSNGISTGSKDITRSFLEQAKRSCTSFSSSAEAGPTGRPSAATEVRAFVLQALESVSFSDCRRKNVRKQASPGEAAGPPVLGFNVGLTDDYVRGPTLSKAARERPNLTKLLCAFAQREIPGFCFTSIQVNKDYASAMHVDKNDAGTSYIIGLGDYTGGRLWLDVGGERGRAVDLRGRWYSFDGHVPHCVLPFKGRRYTIVYFSRHQGGEISLNPSHADLAKSLCELGFLLPTEISDKARMNLIESKQKIAAASVKYERFRAAFIRRPRALLKLLVMNGQHPEVHVSMKADAPVRLLLQAVVRQLRLGSPEGWRLRVGSFPLLPDETPRALGLGSSGSFEEVRLEELPQLERTPFFANVSGGAAPQLEGTHPHGPRGAAPAGGQRRSRSEFENAKWVDMTPEKVARRSDRLGTTMLREKNVVNQECEGEDID